MRDTGRTFSPGISDIFWCMACNLPTFSEKCICGESAKRIHLSPPADVRLCSSSGRDLLKELFNQDYGCSDFLGERIILLNKIAGIDRRDQVFLDGYHIATLWFDITTGTFRLDLELAGAALLAKRAKKSLVTCQERMLKGHIKGKWIKSEFIQDQPPDLVEGDNVILRIGKFTGTGVVRKREDGSRSIRVKEVTQNEFQLSDRVPTLDDVIRANQAHLLSLEKRAVKELKDYLSRTRLPVNISFSGGKDSLAAAILALKVKPRAEMLFINTQLEFPETLQYVREFCRAHKLRLHEIAGKSSFFEAVQSFGPPAKDFRWCCKTNKLGPMTSFIQEHYPKGCVTIEGRRIYESFNRAKIGFVERNPYVPTQTTLAPIRDWRALEVMLYIRWNRLEPNPLYDMDFERIGCWLCPAQLQSEFAGLRKSHPQLYEQWTGLLNSWAAGNGLDQRFVDWGFWRWKRHPPKMLEIAQAHSIDLHLHSAEKKDISLQVVRGRSPCGLEYSIEATLSAPQRHPFPLVAGALNMLGEVKYSEDLGAALVRNEKGRVTVFANGHLMIIAPQKEAEELLEKAVEIILRVQMCTACGICEKNCPRNAISVGETFTIDEERCNRCGKCANGCIAADEAAKIYRRLVAAEASTS